MNKRIIPDKTKKPFEFKLGDLLVEPDTENIYIVSLTNDEYVCISLQTGIQWGIPTENIYEATDGLNFYKRDVTIKIE